MPARGLHIGHFFNQRIKDFGKALNAYEHDRHAILFGPSGSGKFTRFVAVNLLSDCLGDRSVIVIDPKGEAAAVTAWYRSDTLGHDVKILDPFGKLHEAVKRSPDPRHREMIAAGLTESDGFNPFIGLDAPKRDRPNPNFFDDAAAIGEALIKIEGKDPHWTESAQGLLVAMVMWERMTRGTDASLETVRKLLTEADDWDDVTSVGDDGKPRTEQRQTRGLAATVARMVKDSANEEFRDSGGFEVASLAGRFVHATDEMLSIRSSADTQTRWILSKQMRADMNRKPGIDFRDLKTRPTTVYVILPAERLRTHSVWLRLVLVSALRALYRPGGLQTTILIDEMAALGHLGPLEDAFGLVRGFGVQLAGILQDLGQLKALYQERHESFLANAGLVQCLTPNDLTTADWMSRRAGERTIWAKGLSESGAAGVSGDRTTESWSQVQVRHLPAYELFGLAKGTGLAWIAGEAGTIKFAAPNYWDIPECKARALWNPYAGD